MLSLRLTARLRHQRGLLLLLALLLRAYVPVGYMPSAAMPWQLEICPEGLAAGGMAHHHEHGGAHPDAHGHFAHCPFGALPAVGPALHSLWMALPPRLEFLARESREIAVFSVPSARAYRARAPPLTSHA